MPGPVLGEMQGEAARLAGESSDQGEEASPEGLGGGHRFAQTDARCPVDQVMGDDLDSQPGGIGGETALWQVVEPHAIFQVAEAFSISAWRRWSASRSRVSLSRSVMKA